jgi:hypothetical protein
LFWGSIAEKDAYGQCCAEKRDEQFMVALSEIHDQGDDEHQREQQQKLFAQWLPKAYPKTFYSIQDSSWGMGVVGNKPGDILTRLPGKYQWY